MRITAKLGQAAPNAVVDAGGAAAGAAAGVLLIVVVLIAVVLRRQHALRSQIDSQDSQLLTILDGLPVAVMLRAADGTLLHINPGGERFVQRLGLGVSHVSSSPSSLLDHVRVIDEDGRPYEPERLPVVSAMRDGTSRDAILGYALPEGGWCWYAVRAAPVLLSDGTTGTVVTLDDVTARRALEDDLRAAAVEDPLTGLGNRRALTQRLSDARHRQVRGSGDIGLLYLDLDDFKTVNDTRGHDVGDRVLIETAHRLRGAMREVDMVCRLGGDEFVVLCEDVTEAALRDVVQRLTSLPLLTVDAEGEQVSVSASIGWIIVEPGENLDRALRRADAAMYSAKRGQPATIHAGSAKNGPGSTM